MDNKTSNKTLKLAPLDGLRGFAALLVVLSHTSNEAMFFIPHLDGRGIGKSGVFLFFLLSSFLLARVLIAEKGNITDRRVLSKYFQRRFFRIYPLYTLYLLLGLISTTVALVLGMLDLGVPFTLNIKEFFGHIFLLEGKGVTWSIAVEFKFYFALPFLIFIYSFINKWANIYVGVLFFVGLIGLSQLYSPQSASLQNDSSLLPYAPIFLIGIILAIVQSELKLDIFKRSPALTFLTYIVAAFLLFTTPTIYSLFMGYVENNHFHQLFIEQTLLWAIVLFSIINCKTFISKFFESKLLTFYGNLSFSLYLFHPVFIGISKTLSLDTYWAAWFVLISSTLASYMSYILLEKPASKIYFQ